MDPAHLRGLGRVGNVVSRAANAAPIEPNADRQVGDCPGVPGNATVPATS